MKSRSEVNFYYTQPFIYSHTFVQLLLDEYIGSKQIATADKKM